jgi:hypothetical protein
VSAQHESGSNETPVVLRVACPAGAAAAAVYTTCVFSQASQRWYVLGSITAPERRMRTLIASSCSPAESERSIFCVRMCENVRRLPAQLMRRIPHEAERPPSATPPPSHLTFLHGARRNTFLRGKNQRVHRADQRGARVGFAD